MSRLEVGLMVALLGALLGCGIPKLKQALKGETLHCKIEVVMPEGAQATSEDQLYGHYVGYFGPGEKVIVDAVIKDCE